MTPLFLAAALAAAAPQAFADTVPAGPVYDGSRGELNATIPRIEDPDVRIDGRMDEAAWERAALLTGFTQYQPVEGAPASERTEVRVFYTESELYVAIRAHAQDPSRIRSTLAERDRITADDHVRIFLDTFLDRRRAFALYVNPLGIQQDGTYADGRGNSSFSPDFIFDSRGRLTPEGYEVELRIPLKSLKFSSASEQRWGIQVVRVIRATGAEESWAPRGQNEPSELARAGTLSGMRDLRPGRLLELNPTLTARRDGALEDGRFRRGPVEPDVGLNVKYGITSELTLDATVNPDFSQVEADADQITVNERFALSLDEKRPFFLEGADLFSTPETLVYTRSIVSPVAGARVTGNVGGFSVAYLGALDDASRDAPARYAPDADPALVQVMRVRRDVGSEGSTVGALTTLREVGSAFNRVASADLRLRRGAHTVSVQAGGSWTRAWVADPAGADSAGPEGSRVAVATEDRRGHIARLVLDRTGRRWGYLASLRDVPAGFRTETGFVRRRGVTELMGGNRLSWYGAPGARVQRVDLRTGGSILFQERGLWQGDGAAEGGARATAIAQLAGNHDVEVSWARSFYTIDAADYARYSTGITTGDLLVDGGRIGAMDGFTVEFGSSHWKWLRFGVDAGTSEVPIFAEGVRGREWGFTVDAELRPTDALRIDARLRRSVLHRAPDGSRYSDAIVPRLRVEYQLTRAIAFRALAQYPVEKVDLLRAPDGTPYLLDGEPFRLRRGNTPPWTEPQLNPLRLDLLFSYRPSPGTLVFLGYGRESADDEAFRFRTLDPRSDGVFFKVSYLFRR